MSDPTFDNILKSFCDAGAMAVYLYADISGEAPFEDMPEYWMPAMIMKSLSTSLVFTLETTFSKLLDWNNGSHRQRGQPTATSHDTKEIMKIAEVSHSSRVDMAIFQPDQENPSDKDKASLWALAEFKKTMLNVERDRAKLMDLLAHIDTCRYGIVCGMSADRDMDNRKADAEKARDLWYSTRILPMNADDGTYFFCARAFSAG